MRNFSGYSSLLYKYILIPILCMALVGGSCTFSVAALEEDGVETESNELLNAELVVEEPAEEPVEEPAEEELVVEETSEESLVEEESEEKKSEEELEEESLDDYNPDNPDYDPQWEREMARQSDGCDDDIPALSLSPNSGYTHDSRFDDMYEIHTGIDVSYYQGSINWPAVAQDGVDFAFIRVGFRGYGSTGSLNEDSKFRANLNGAISAGIPVGVYFFSQAITEAEAVEEAQYILNRIGGYNITLPVIMDFEYANKPTGRLYKTNLTNAQQTAICNAFCNKVTQAGYTAMVYADYSMLTTRLNASAIDNNYKIWIARWNKSTGYSRPYDYWQYSDKGTVNGIKGTVDLDFGYWYVPKHHITYELGIPGAVNGNNPTLFYEGATETELEIASSEGRIFEGWYTESTFLNEVTRVNKNWSTDITLYAKWVDIAASEEPVYITGNSEALETGAYVELGCDTRDARIYYTTNSSKGTSFDADTWTLYEGPLEMNIEKSTVTSYSGGVPNYGKIKIYAISVCEGRPNSNIVSLEYTIHDDKGEWGDISEEDRLAGGLSQISDIPESLWAIGLQDKSYTGSSITQENLKVFFGKTQLTRSKDYTLRYRNNINAGTGTVVISGKGNYKGTLSETFHITPMSLDGAIVTSSKLLYAADGKVHKAKVSVKIIGANGKTKTLTEGKDYSVRYVGLLSNDPDYIEGAFASPGEYTIRIIGMGNYDIASHVDIKERIITAKLLSSLKYTIKGGEYNNREAVYPTITVRNNGVELNGYLVTSATSDSEAAAVFEGLSNRDSYQYFYYCTSNRQASSSAKVHIIGNETAGFAGSVIKTYKISGVSINKATVTPIEDQIFTGKLICPVPVVTWGGSSLTGSLQSDYEGMSDSEQQNINYVYRYSNNTNCGIAKIYITGVNGYSGTISKGFRILSSEIYVEEDAPSQEESTGISELKIILDDTGSTGIKSGLNAYPYNPGGVKPAVMVQVKNSDGTYSELTQNKDYRILYSNFTAAGTAQLCIIGKGSYKGTITQNYIIEPIDIADSVASAQDVIYQNKSGTYQTEVVLTSAGGRRLVKEKDYTITGYAYATTARVSYQTKAGMKTVLRRPGDKVESTDIIPLGTKLQMTVSGKDNYSGTQNAYYYTVKDKITNARISVKAQSYTGKAVCPGKKDITVIINGQKLQNSDYRIVGYSNNINKGIAKITIAGSGKYGGTKTVSFRIYRR